MRWIIMVLMLLALLFCVTSVSAQDECVPPACNPAQAQAQPAQQLPGMFMVQQPAFLKKTRGAPIVAFVTEPLAALNKAAKPKMKVVQPKPQVWQQVPTYQMQLVPGPTVLQQIR